MGPRVAFVPLTFGNLAFFFFCPFERCLFSMYVVRFPIKATKQNKTIIQCFQRQDKQINASGTKSPVNLRLFLSSFWATFWIWSSFYQLLGTFGNNLLAFWERNMERPTL